MRVHLTIDPLLATSKLDKERIVRALSESLGLSRQAAALRLDRAISDETDSLRKDLLGQLFGLAREVGVDWRDLLRLETADTVFDLLPGDRTYTYLGGYGTANGEGARYSESITAAVADYRSARRFAQRITRDFSFLRFAPSMSAPENEIVSAVRGISEAADAAGSSILSIGSNKVNTMSEWLLADALRLTPFREWGEAQGRPPVEFAFAVTELERKWLCAGSACRCNARMHDAAEIGHSSLTWNGRRYQYHPIHATVEPPSPPEKRGRDFAVVVVNAVTPTRANVVVAGLTGVATFGASALLCHEPARFDRPEKVVFVRLFLVEVEFWLAESVGLRLPLRARVVEHWTRSTGRFGEPSNNEWTDLGLVSAGVEPNLFQGTPQVSAVPVRPEAGSG